VTSEIMMMVVLLGTSAARHKHRPAPKPAPPPVEKAAAAPKKSDKPVEVRTEVSRDVIKRESKIEFDERAVQGQRAQGAVYLFQRAESEFRSLVRTPDTFRDRTVKSVYGDK
jgi:hypothetical protein